MNTISTQALKTKLDQHQPVQLLMTQDRASYERQHIPNSMHYDYVLGAADCLEQDCEIIVYATNPACPACYRAYYRLRSQGFKNLVWYSGGLEEWVSAGLPVEGSDQLPS